MSSYLTVYMILFDSVASLASSGGKQLAFTNAPGLSSSGKKANADK